MPFYANCGEVPHKRHTQFRQPDGTLYHEEVFGTKGFSGIQSILYHAHAPTAVCHVERLSAPPPDAEEAGPLRHRHFRTAHLTGTGDPIAARQFLLANEDVALGVCTTDVSMTDFYKNAGADELLFVHEGSGTLASMFGTIAFGPGDYLVIPVGTIYQLVVDQPIRYLILESPSQIEVPHRYRNEYGQYLEHAPFCERDLRLPTWVPPIRAQGAFPIRVKKGHDWSLLSLAHHPFDVIGWDGYVYPYAFNIADFEPITGRVHLPPPVHQTFAGHNFVVCSFVPRLFDYHPLAIPVPYNHSNVDSDEVLYYVRGNFMSRRGIEIGSITLHPSGIPHGPHPGTVEASLGKHGTEELAVMVDTFRPLRVLTPALAVEDAGYMYSWT